MNYFLDLNRNTPNKEINEPYKKYAQSSLWKSDILYEYSSNKPFINERINNASATKISIFCMLLRFVILKFKNYLRKCK